MSVNHIQCRKESSNLGRLRVFDGEKNLSEMQVS